MLSTAELGVVETWDDRLRSEGGMAAGILVLTFAAEASSSRLPILLLAMLEIREDREERGSGADGNCPLYPLGPPTTGLKPGGGRERGDEAGFWKTAHSHTWE